jgi:cysteine-rich repeat protein
MMANWKSKMRVPAFAFAACMILGTAQVARATFICAGPGSYACKDGAPNGVCQQGEECDDGNTINGDGCDNNCMKTACGNGVITAGEECDNGASNDDVSQTQNPFPGNACDTSCRLKSCGNGRIEGGEVCDDGNAFNNDGCDSDPATVFSNPANHPGLCLGSGCGNGITNMNEMMAGGCDDGNTQSGDGCSATCVSEFCGDGISNNAPNETCDDGNTIDNDHCSNACVGSICGDGVTQTAVEQCDDGNTVNIDSCRNDCTTSRCGDGISDIGEACDDGNTVNDATCNGDCSKVPVCGDAVTDPNEGCDDGACACIAPKKAANGRSCADAAGRTACAADGGTCFNAAKGAACGVAAGDGNLDDIADACRSTCESASCGDGITDSGEVCDDGLNGPTPQSVDDTDSCPNGSTMFFMGMACQMINTCGDGIANSDATGGNTCDNGEGTNPKTCSKAGTLCSVSADCPAGETCGNSDAAGGTCHTTAFTDPECPNGPGAGACACHAHYCGDGATDAGEGCDDGNTVSGDGCQGNCALPTCGDGVTDAGEACDAGAQNGMSGNNGAGSSCTKQCQLNICGDGEALDGETCDDGNVVNTDGCKNDCTAGVCGDGVTRTSGATPLEQCDDGNTIDAEGATGGTDGCSGHCCWEPTVALSTTQGMLDAQACNLDALSAEVSALPAGRTKSRLTRHVLKALKLQSQVVAAVAAGSGRKACSAEKRKDRIVACEQRALDLGLIRGEIDATTHREISQKVLNIHGWVQNIRQRIGCL